MDFTIDPISLVNLILCVIIVILASLRFRKNKNTTAFFIGFAFGLFGISHLLIFFGLKSSLESFLITIRIIAYLSVIAAVYKIAK
ncbi:MAG: hypothetical protein K9L84_04115 [Candidatus Omnitrophica bacterium]|nr:hypothetical protein [Candidatus Omnitrophota bacterium]MCF7894226.1 hypothetical protein [Candidatus Omnitrophota bacterium]